MAGVFDSGDSLAAWEAADCLVATTTKPTKRTKFGEDINIQSPSERLTSSRKDSSIKVSTSNQMEAVN